MEYTKQTSEDFDYYFKHLSQLPERLNTKASEGEDLVLFYSSRVYADQNSDKDYLSGNVFLHGIFFAHQVEQAPRALIGSQGSYYVYPEIPSHEWKRNPYA